ncbi:hypothetical protein [Providencia rettgeri]|uniref:hypothetical protein n=1 Tax=Providencia rettgeri TaxID=587 RepID=UPI00235F57BA|nr:hypothetical protein [Providencia rettgeri]
MNNIQLLLLTLNCINENREPSHAEQSRIYVFYKTEIESMNISIDIFMLTLMKTLDMALINSQKSEDTFNFLNVHMNDAAIKSKSRSLMVNKVGDKFIQTNQLAIDKKTYSHRV